jgi:hypothetical protein
MAKLPYKVECKSMFAFYEVIAAFDCEPAAKRYVEACEEGARATNSTYLYRVVKK